MLDPSLSRIAIAGVIALICFLAYASQLFLLHPHLSQTQTIFFNVLVGCIWITYARSIFTHPGSPPKDWAPAELDGDDAEEGRGRAEERRLVARGATWCRKCEAYKPPRSHHCKTCKVCVLRMDHHCPWTNNCVGYRNLPHFIQFLFYSCITCAYLFTHLLARGWAVWESRSLPSYHGPHTLLELFLLTILLLTDFLVTFFLTILYIRTLWSSAEGYTSIEYWEQERHDALVRKKRVRKQEFPYDIGIWDNLCSAHGATGNILAWYWPLARTRDVGEVIKGSGGLRLKGGVEWEINGYEDLSMVWPPPDPDKAGPGWLGRAQTLLGTGVDEPSDVWVEGVRRRQKEDLKRWQGTEREGQRELSYPRITDRHRWTNEEGETLADYGVDEEAGNADEDAENADEDVPLAELMQRRKLYYGQ